jgi:hypothetical protein
MMCPKCGEKWGVTNTVPSGAGLNRGSQLASWYCEDFVVRIRRCRSCNYRNTTIELIISDVYKMFKIVGDEGIDIIEYSEIGGRNEAKKPSKS